MPNKDKWRGAYQLGLPGNESKDEAFMRNASASQAGLPEIKLDDEDLETDLETILKPEMIVECFLADETEPIEPEETGLVDPKLNNRLQFDINNILTGEFFSAIVNCNNPDGSPFDPMSVNYINAFSSTVKPILIKCGAMREDYSYNIAFYDWRQNHPK